MLIRCAFEKNEKSRQSGAETTHELLKKGLTSQGGADQKLQGTEFDMVISNVFRIRFELYITFT